jgi:hypothetical protein
MSASENGGRVLAPGDPDADEWRTRTCKTVLAIAPHLQAGTRLAFDVLPHLESDPRIQVVWSTPDTGYRWGDFDRFVRDLRGLVVPWHQAIDTRYDLVLAACFWGLAETTGHKVLLPHGISGVRSRIGPHPGPVPHDMHPGQLMRDGKVVPSALVVPHESELAVIRETCPETLPRVVVAGDPCFDRMLVSRHLRRRFRRALGVRRGQKLVVVTTTWSPHSLFGNDGWIFTRLTEALPPKKYRVVAVVHPFTWYYHSRRTLLAWLTRARAAGLVVLPPEEGWRAALIAADIVVGDHGSVTQYAAALGIPVLLNSRSLVDVRPDSTAAATAELATPLDIAAPLLPQVRRALATRPHRGVRREHHRSPRTIRVHSAPHMLRVPGHPRTGGRCPGAGASTPHLTPGRDGKWQPLLVTLLTASEGARTAQCMRP